MQIEVREVPEVSVAYMAKVGVSMSEIGEAFMSLIHQVLTVVGPQGALSGPCFGRYNNWSTENGGDLDVGFIVNKPVEGAGILNGRIGGCRCVVATHVGSYDDLKNSWEAAYAWLHQNGHTDTTAPWELYLDDPDTTPAETLRTEICIPIAV